MIIKVDDFKKVLPRTAKSGDVVTLYADGGSLDGVVAVPDYRIVKSAPCDGQLSEVSVPAEPLVKALGTRANDLPVKVELTETGLQLFHGEFSLQVPKLGKPRERFTFPENYVLSTRLPSAVKRVASLLQKEDRQGVMLAWGDGSICVFAMSTGRLHREAWSGSTPESPGRVCISKPAAEQIGKLDHVFWAFDANKVYVGTKEIKLRVSPIKDDYPSSLEEEFTEAGYTVTVDKDAMYSALRTVISVFSKDDITVDVKSSAGVSGGVVLDLSAKNIHTGCKSLDKVLARTDSRKKMSARVNGAALLSSLDAAESGDVEITFGSTLVLVRGGYLTAATNLLV